MRFIVVLFLSFSVHLFGQTDGEKNLLQARVNALGEKAISLTYSPIQDMREYTAKMINDSLAEIFSSPESFSLNYDSFKNISVQKSSDDRVKIFTWNYISDSGFFKIYGFLLLNPQYYAEYYFPLTPFTQKIDTAHQTLTPDNWYPALYYDIFTYKHRRKCYYMLTGFNGGTPWLDQRVVELLYIDKRDEPQFGLPVFHGVKSNEKTKSRLIFKYASQATMVCRIEKDKKILVFSHLVPVRWQRLGDFEYYAPDGTYDIYKLKKGKWQRYDMPMDFSGNQRGDD